MTMKQFWTYALPLGTAAINLTALASICAMGAVYYAKTDDGWWAFLSLAFSVVITIGIGWASWHARGQSILAEDWDDIVACKDANVHPMALSKDLLDNLNGDLVGVWKRNEMALRKLGYWREL